MISDEVKFFYDIFKIKQFYLRSSSKIFLKVQWTINI